MGKTTRKIPGTPVPEMPALLVHYAEIALKLGNRAHFEGMLIKNIRTALGSEARREVLNLPGRMMIALREGDEADVFAQRIARVFGVANVAVATRLDPDIDAICATAVALAGSRPFESFAIRARRGEKKFPLNSQEINIRVGDAVRLASGARVDLKHPEFAIGIELLDKHAFVFGDRIPGPGGLPLGSSGKVACLISGGIDSPVASWRMMKRGCRPLFIHFHSAPFTSPDSQDKAEEIVERLLRFQPSCHLAMVPFGEIQKKIVISVPQEYRVVLYRRFMIRIATELAQAYGAQALVTGEALGQVASQTLSNLSAIGAISPLPILRPLVGLDKGEIVDEAKRIGTYDLSIVPHDDCCSFLIPRHPVTSSTAQELSQVEQALDVEGLVRKGVDGVTEQTIEVG